jgi:hypothetical protein
MMMMIPLPLFIDEMRILTVMTRTMLLLLPRLNANTSV